MVNYNLGQRRWSQYIALLFLSSVLIYFYSSKLVFNDLEFNTFSSHELSDLKSLTSIEIFNSSRQFEQDDLSSHLKSLTSIEIFNSSRQFDQDDLSLLKYIRDHHVFPSDPTRPRIIKGYPHKRDPKIYNLIMEYQSGPGTFIECGANDGEFYSNTLYLEVTNDWTGILIEASPTLFKQLQRMNRNAWIVDTCLSGEKPETIEFLKHKDKSIEWRAGNGKINPGKKYKPHKMLSNQTFKREDYESEGMVECFPLFSILQATNLTRIDYFSLDVEGHEYQILKAIPFDKVYIGVLHVEHWLAPEGKEAIKDLILSNGYILAIETESDYVFKKDRN